MCYLRSHWRGEQGFAWSFWINLVAVRVAVFALQSAWSAHAAEPEGLPLPSVVVCLFFAHGVLLVWQAVGVIRAGEAYVREYGSGTNMIGAQLGIVALVLLTLAWLVEGYQTTLARPVEDFDQRMTREHEATYAIEMLDNDHELRLQGLIAYGVTRRLQHVLDENPGIDSIVLESAGGNIYEGRGLARLFRERGLATRVDVLCASACTLAFIGGTRRSLARGARFGLHGYRVDGQHAMVVTDPESEQRRDGALFRDAGVSAGFVERMFDAGADDMWWPRIDELSKAGVLLPPVE